jgi:hypothetical protein
MCGNRPLVTHRAEKHLLISVEALHLLHRRRNDKRIRGDDHRGFTDMLEAGKANGSSLQNCSDVLKHACLFVRSL